MLVVGAVAGLRDHLRWFDDRPLFGRRIVVTRSREQAASSSTCSKSAAPRRSRRRRSGSRRPRTLAALDRACAEAGTFDWIVFTSANAVDRFMARLAERRHPRAEGRAHLRDRTVHGLDAPRYGIRVDLTPAEARRSGAGGAEGARGSPGTRFLLPRADIARELLADELRGAGADVTEVAVYRTSRRKRARRRLRHLPDAARSADRRGHVHERVTPCGTSRKSSAGSRPPTCFAPPSSPRSAR